MGGAPGIAWAGPPLGRHQGRPQAPGRCRPCGDAALSWRRGLDAGPGRRHPGEAACLCLAGHPWP
eukprot:5706864-Lingulodinium_polyedra.AAC.1